MRDRNWFPAITRLSLTGCTLLAVLAFSSCGPTDPDAATRTRAVEVYKEVVELSGQKDMAVYGLRVATRSRAPETGEILAGSVSSGIRDISYEALRGLVSREVPAAREALQSAFDKKKGAPKVVAALALAQLGVEDAGAWLDGQVSEGNVVPSIEALQYLVESGREETAKTFLQAQIASGNDEQKDLAYAMLGEIGQPWAHSMLVAGFEKEHGARRKQAIVALGRAGDPSDVRKISKYVNTQGLVFASIEALGAIGDPAARDRLVRASKHEESLVRVYAGTALWKLGDGETAAAVLQPLAADGDATIRLNLAEQLAGIEAEGAVALLATLAGDADKGVRRAAFVSLLESGNPDMEALFITGASDADYEIATAALECLSRYGTRTALAAVEPLMENENPYVAVTAAGAVLDILARHPSAEPAG